jgi:hypothetical protein
LSDEFVLRLLVGTETEFKVAVVRRCESHLERYKRSLRVVAYDDAQSVFASFVVVTRTRQTPLN